MSNLKQVHLGVNVLASGRHDAAWKTLPHPEKLPTDIDTFIRIAQIAERGKIDALFLAENAGGFRDEGLHRPWRALDPIVLHAALSQSTKHIGVVATTTSLFGHPYTIARQIASLNHVSKGRAAWNITTGQAAEVLEAYGVEKGFEQNDRYLRASEFTEIVTRLWDSLPEEAIVADVARHVFVDEEKLQAVNFKGKHFSSSGVLQTPAGWQRPVIFQAGQSEESKAFGARYADALFTGQRTLENGKKFYRDTKGLARAFGRDPSQFLVIPGLFPILGSTEAEALRHKRELDEQLDHEFLLEELARFTRLEVSDFDLNQPLPFDKIEAASSSVPVALRWHRQVVINEARAKGLTTREVLLSNLTGGHRAIVGTPEQIAANILEWLDNDAADGFNLNVAILPGGLEDIVDHLIPVLQKAGRFRTEYTGQTLREHLGLKPYVARSGQSATRAA
ncbi:nitrilotriacetate monooxygenase [Betaproteobacteria bacterium]|nr:nitrilotriacetate monooxygenase [Betaproteobacteria bacterium]GHU11456.1 nitrilotriacetate monooxygenase [Betaproteobacteria bacterium]GHU17860.1 nitrilotriacetate monooxygenase [Betaproteobacteria bacterium]